MSDAFPLLVATDLRNWGTGLKFFADVFAYNLLSATKFVNELVKKLLKPSGVVNYSTASI